MHHMATLKLDVKRQWSRLGEDFPRNPLSCAAKLVHADIIPNLKTVVLGMTIMCSLLTLLVQPHML